MFCAVLCTASVHNDTHVREQFLKMSVGLGLGLVFCTFFCFSLDYFVRALFAFVVLELVSLVLFCVE